MRSLIFVFFLLLSGAAYAKCPAVTSDCPSPTFNNLTVGGSFNPTSISTTTLSASGATTLSGAATLSGGGSLAGTFSGTPTFSGALTFTGALTINNTTQTQGLGTFLAGIWTHQNIVLSG